MIGDMDFNGKNGSTIDWKSWVALRFDGILRPW